MEQAIRHTTDWTHSTLASWLGVSVSSLYYAHSKSTLLLQLPLHLMILALLWFVIKRPNEHVNRASVTYFSLIILLMTLTSTTLVFIHLVMFTAIFCSHLSPARIIAFVGAILSIYCALNFERWEGNIPWITIIVWSFFCLMNWFVSRRIIESLNVHYQSRQNFKELKATQSVMRAMSAEQERLNLSRELHDTLGHKLTALSINLDFAKRKATSESVKTLSLCHELSQELLEQVRDIVSNQRRETSLLRASLEHVFSATPQLKCRLDLAEKLSFLDQKNSLCLIRFCQEMISNTLKHTQATEIAFDINVCAQQENKSYLVVATAIHNQSEQAIPKKGNGLKGLEERMAMVNGQFTQCIEASQLINKITFPLQLAHNLVGEINHD